VITNGLVTVLAGIALSVNWTVKGKAPAVVGVPPIKPAEDKVRPPGRSEDPGASDHV